MVVGENMVLNKRILRELKSNIFQYASLFFLLLIGMTMIIGLSSSTDSITQTVESHAKKNKIEDGNFSLITPLPQSNIQELSQKGAQLEEESYLDFSLSDGSALRIFKNRKNINLIELNEGKLASNANEIVLEKHYADQHHYDIGSTISFGNNSYRITGIGTVPDYDNLLPNISDINSNSIKFSIAFVSNDAYNSLRNNASLSKGEQISYSYRLTNNMTALALKNYLINHVKSQNLTSFIQAKENTRIYASIIDSNVNKTSALSFGVIYLIMIAYIISIFVVHNIESESSIIGALYSLGYYKKDLLKHYLILPVLVVATGGISGTILGLSLTRRLSAYNGNIFSYPELSVFVAPYLIAYGILLPILIAITINFIVINRKLSQTPLALLRKEKKISKISNINLGKMDFINRYRIRQMLRETRGNIFLSVGLSLAILIMVFGVLVYTSIINVATSLGKDVKFNYMYILKSPTPKMPDGGEEYYTEFLYSYCKYTNNDLGITLQGINPENHYYNFKISKDASVNELYISSSVSKKFDWKKGDEVTLENHLANKNYTFIVKDVVDYGNELYVFMNIDSMRKLFYRDNNYYNTILSKESLNIDSKSILSITTADDIKRIGETFIEQDSIAIVMVLCFSVLLFILVMFLILKIMIDKSTFSISLLKVFGYSEKEIKKLYLGSNFYIVLITGIIATPLSKIIMDSLYPYMVSKIALGLDTTFGFKQYGIIGLIILGSYFLSNIMLSRHLRKVSLVEILKTME